MDIKANLARFILNETWDYPGQNEPIVNARIH